MTISLKHAFNNAIADDPADALAGKTLPSHWNAEHTVTGTANRLLGFDGIGASAEVTVGTGLSLSGNSLTATGGGGTPGGSSLTVQYNNAGAFDGMAGTSWDATNKALTIASATVTTNKPVLDLRQTWNNSGITFEGVVFDATRTASGAESKGFNFKQGGISGIVGRLGTAALGPALHIYETTFGVADDTNFRRGSISVDGNNKFIIGTEVGGTTGGPALNMSIRSDQTISFENELGTKQINFNAPGNYFNIDSAGYFYWRFRAILLSPADGVLRVANNDFNDATDCAIAIGLATSAGVRLHRTIATTTLNVQLGDGSGNAHLNAASVRGAAVTFANVPATPVEGMLVAVTDSTTATWGATITGTGSNHVLAYYNGTNWTVAGK